MIGYLFTQRILSAFKSLKNPWNIVLHLFILLTTWSYAWVFARLSNDIVVGNLEFVEIDMLFKIVWASGAILTIGRMIIPSYSPMKEYFPAYFPLTKWQKHIISVVLDLQNSFFFYALLFIILSAISLNYEPILFATTSVSILFSAHFCRRIIQYFIDKKLKSISWAMLVATFIIVLLIVWQQDFFVSHAIVTSVSLPIILFAMSYFLSLQVLENKKITSNNTKKEGNIYWKLLINNPKVRIPLGAAFLFKIFIVAIDFYLYKTKSKHFFDGLFIYWLFASPLVLFTYVFNNLWGFWRNLWLNYELRVGQYDELIKFSLGLLFIPLSVDFIFTVPFLLLSWTNYEFILIFYVTAILILVSFSALWSLLFPIAIKSGFQLKGTSSFISSAISMLMILSLSLMKLTTWFYGLIPIYLILSFIAYKFALSHYQSKKYAIMEKIKE